MENYTKNENSHYNSVPLKFPPDFINPYKEVFQIFVFIMFILSFILNFSNVFIITQNRNLTQY